MAVKEQKNENGVAETLVALGDGEMLFRSVFDHCPSGIVLADRQGQIVLANPAFCRLLQYSEGELKALTVLDITHPDDRDASAKVLQEERRAQAPLDLEKRYLRKDGEIVWGHVTASTWIGTDTYPVVSFAIVQDITERIRQQSEQWRETQFLHRLVHAAQAIILVLDNEGRIVQFNEYMEGLCGYEVDEVCGRDWFHTFAPCDEAERRRFLQQEKDPQKQLRRTVQSILTRNGERRSIQWSIDTLKDTDDTISGILSIGIDITEQRRAEREALVEKERSRAILATAPDGIVTIDEHGFVESFNPSAEEMFGYQQHDIVGQNVRVLLPSSYGFGNEGITLEFLRSALGELTGVGQEFEARHSNGHVFPVHLAVAQMQVGDKRGFCGFIRNLTESKRVEEQLRQSQKMEAVGSLASGVAHDFNNLLMGVSGCVAVALKCVDSGRSNRLYLGEIKKAVETGAAMTKQLLAFSRKAEVEFKVLEFDEVVGAQEALLRRLLGEDIDFQVRLEAEKSHVCADVGQLDQVLMNLAVNARDAMPTGGRLTIETKAVTLATAMPGNLKPGEELLAGQYVSLAVTDSGVGMSSTTREHLFEPFYTTKDPGEGTGLGLATVYGIVKHAGGHIDVHAVEPRGTRFEILLPQVFPEHSTPEPKSRASDKRGRNETILLCEDDHLVRMSLRYYLEGAGYRVLTSQSAADAIERCQQSAGPIDLLLTDVVLPDESGERIARSVSALQPGIKVLYMSAHTAQWLKREGRIDDELPTLQKPFSEEFLLTSVAKILGSTKPAPKIEHRAPRLEPEQLAPLAGAPGTVLLVDDDDAIRLSLGQSFQELGYHVLSASDGLEAVAVAKDHDGPITALVVDAVLPKLMGVAVAREVQTMYPSSRIIYMSGYARDVALQSEVVGDALFAQKPVFAHELHEMIQGPQPGYEALIHTSRRRIMVVEDSSVARLAIAELLKGEEWGVKTAENGADALSLLQAGNCDFDVLLVDYSLPDMKGDVLAGRIREVHADVAVAYMSGYSGLRLDPPGPLLTKPLDLDTLTDTLLALHAAPNTL
jgi:PAS domain S-box-containing protein